MTRYEEIPLLPEVKQFLAQEPYPFFIGNEWHSPNACDTIPVYNPATGKIIARVLSARCEDVAVAAMAARGALEGAWHRCTPHERSLLLWKLADAIERHADILAQLETLNNGKPLAIARASDVSMSVKLFRYMAGWATKLEGSTIPISSQYFAYTVREPVGVVAQIIPWNFPLMMAAWKLAPALAAGCTVILKPAEQTPLTALYLGKLIKDVGFPPGVVNILPGYGEITGAALAKHSQIDKVAFTGSTEVGKKIVESSAQQLKRVSLELGGKSPAILLKDADLEKSIPDAANAIFFNSGQCCSAGSRLFVERSVYDEVVDGIVAYAKRLQLGSGLLPTTDLGPLVSREQLEKVSSYVQEGIAQGSSLLCGGSQYGDEGYFYEPTVLVPASHDSRIVREEVFGPVVTIMPFQSHEEVIALANDSIYGLAAGIWTRKLSAAHFIASRLRVGTVWINEYNVANAALPFGGFKQSGYGREMGHAVFEQYTELKSVCISL